jgi:hypothetical protein
MEKTENLSPNHSYFKSEVIMTDKEIEQIKQKMYAILNNNEIADEWKCDELHKLAVESNAPPPPGGYKKYPLDYMKMITQNIHTVLQTETMVNTCNIAKRSCMWAAIAAFIALLATIAAWITVILTIRGA